MKRGLSLAFACALVASAGWPIAAIARPMQCATVSNAIVESQFHRFNDSWATGDPAKVAALFTPDAVLLATVSNTPRTTSPAIRDYFVHFLEGKPVAHIDTSTIRLGCNMAARFGTWSIDLNDAAGKRTTVHARYTFIYTYARGQWWIDHLHSSKMPETKPAH